ncbi:probable serine/threonine-protein kinase DDB_G0275165 [Macrobrachium rosenbergii]|uniref:probable serine/threonine-protein kinase DDB_G0275165 n=1 Tax=Macrobrachium rosenbergii TaxID=79674 RepID=UPI0034D51F6D
MGQISQRHGAPILPSSQSLLQPRLLLFLLLFLLVGSQQPPPNYPHDMMPDTNFTCSDKATGGYYADPEAGCQMFHVCVKVSDEEIRDFRFLCPNNTVFDQQNFICTNWWDINCKQSTRYYSKNDLFRVDETTANQDYDYEEPFTTYEYVYEYDDSQTRNSPDYEYDYYDTEADHRFGSGSRGRKGKSQDSSTARSTNLSTTTSTTSTTTSTTPRPISSTTTTTPRPIPRTTTPRITTLRPSHNFQSIRIGKPVVSISSSSRYEVSSSSSPSSSTHFTRAESPRAQSSSTRTTRQEDLTGAEDDLYSGAEDPFADFDWRRDSAGVTASTKTRYEQRFRSNAKSRQELPISTASRSQEITVTTTRNDKENERTTTERSRYQGPSRGNRNRSGLSSFSGTRFRASTPDPSLEEFSNFRYYKTAFGNGGLESDQLLSTSSSTTPSPQQPSSGSRVRPVGYISARSASRNTRYSVYG